jgi:hypothetical protein
MRESRLPLRERRPFVGRHVERGELASPRLERIAFRGRCPCRLRRRIALLDRGAPFAPGACGLASERGESAERVDERSLDFRRGERLVRMLAMEIDEPLADLLQLSERGRPAVDPRAASPVAVERAANEQRLVTLGEILGVEPGGDVGAGADIEFGRELGAIGAGTQLTKFEAVAEQ